MAALPASPSRPAYAAEPESAPLQSFAGTTRSFSRSASTASVLDGMRGSARLDALVPEETLDRLAKMGIEKRTYVAQGYRSPHSSIPHPSHQGVWPLGAGPAPSNDDFDTPGSSGPSFLLGNRERWSRTATAPARELLPYSGMERIASIDSSGAGSWRSSEDDEMDANTATSSSDAGDFGTIQIGAGGEDDVLAAQFADDSENTFATTPNTLDSFNRMFPPQAAPRRTALGSRANGLSRTLAQTMPARASESWTKPSLSRYCKDFSVLP